MRSRAWRLLGIGVVATGALAAALIAVGVVTGAYNVAATAEHLYVTDRIIEFALRRSIAVRSSEIEKPALPEPGLAALGGEHFRTGCSPCHGGPGHDQNPIVGGMYPPPPPLASAAQDWSPAQLFWIVQHGIKFTGMPSWPSPSYEHEVWAVVAYLRTLEAGPQRTAPATDSKSTFTFENGHTVESCARCHGDVRGPINRLVPLIHGQKEAYLRRALAEYRAGRRPSGMMQPIAARLTDDDIGRLASHYAAASRTADEPGLSKSPRVTRGREIALRGVPSDNIPPCLACHSSSASPQFPILFGLAPEYIETQLHVLQTGARDGTPFGATMTAIAQRLSPEQIADVAAYFAAEGAEPTLEGNRQ